MLAFDPYQAGLKFGSAGVEQSGLFAAARFYRDGDQSSVAARRRLLDEVATAVPSGVSVTSVPELAGPLYVQRQWLFYPMGIDIVQYAAVRMVKESDGHVYYGGAPNYLGQDEALDRCLTRRMEADGYDVAHPEIVGPFAILRRSVG